MKRNRNKSIIAVIVTAVIAIVCGVFAFTASTRKTNSGDFNGAYSLTAYADTGITKINVLGKEVDVLKIDPLTSIDGNYQLYITVIDTADLIGLDVNLGYGFGEKVFSDLEKEGLTNVVYSSLTSGEEKLTIDEVVEGFGLTNNGFDRPFFAIVEVAKTSILDKIGELVFAEKHTVELVEGKASTCTEDGYKAYYACTNEECNKYFADKYGIKEITDLDAWKKGDGKIVATGHTEVTDEAVAATCTQTGLTEGKHCSVCGAVTVAQTVVEATGHTEVTDEAVAATCTQTGLTEGKHCSVCGAVTVAQTVVEATGHTEVTDKAVAATCTQTGLTEGKHCSVCNTVLTAQTEIPAKGHTEVTDKAVEANCTESGLTEGKHCSVCGTVTVAQTEIPATGHTEVTDEAVAATCTQTGLTEGKHCSVCGAVTVAQTEVPATGHTEVTDEAVEATCTQTGLTEGKHCSVCNTVLTAQTEIPAKGHTTVVVSGQAATCTEDGWNDYYTCSVCGGISSDENGENVIDNLEAWKVGDGKLDAFGHSYINYICTTCGDLEKVAVNGVYYQFTVNDGDSGYHFVACGKADGFSKYTGASAETLVLENEIGGYPVTEIAANAFANTDDEESTAIKSVIVPENIVTIGEKAFQNNYGIERVVFLSESVHLNGSGSNASSTYPFYGCSTYKSDSKVDGKKGNEITKLNVYYNSLTAKDSSDWKLFRYVYNGWWYSFYIQDDGGAIYANGSWSMVGTTISGADIVTECNFADVVNDNVTTGIVNEYYTQTQGDAIKTRLEEALSGYTSNGANKYAVNVTVTNTVNSIATVAITVSLNVPVEVKVNSAVAFSYDLNNQTISEGLTTMKVVKSGDNVILYNPVATNYTFLGWAKEVNGALEFIGSTTQYNADTVYYPIWGHSNAGTTFSASTHTNGSTLVNPTGDGIDGKWYDKNWNQVTEISTANTVVYTRSIFTLTVELKYKAANRSMLHVKNDSIGDKTSKSTLTSGTSIGMSIYEGKATFTLADKVLTVNDGVNVTTIYANEIRSGGSENTNNKRNISSSITGEYNVTTSFSVTLSY